MLSRDRVWDAGRPVDVGATLGPLRRGRGDPAHLLDAAGVFWWACATPDGDATLALRGVSGVVTARSWGPGAPGCSIGCPRCSAATTTGPRSI